MKLVLWLVKRKQHLHVDSLAVFFIVFNYSVLLSSDTECCYPTFVSFPFKWFNSMALRLIESCTHFRFSTSWLWIWLSAGVGIVHILYHTEVIEHEQFRPSEVFLIFSIFRAHWIQRNLHRSTVNSPLTFHRFVHP